MAINLGKNYNVTPSVKKPVKQPPKPIKLSGPTKAFIKFSLWLAALLAGFMVLSSTIISREADRSLVSAIYDNIVGVKQKQIKQEKSFLEREKDLVTAPDAALAKRLSGDILLQVESKGEAWYVYPEDNKKYFLGRPEDAAHALKVLGTGATHVFLSGYTYFPADKLGRIYLDTDANGEAYYINPKDKKAYFLGDPENAFEAMRDLGIGISNQDIRKIEVGELVN